MLTEYQKIELNAFLCEYLIGYTAWIPETQDYILEFYINMVNDQFKHIDNRSYAYLELPWHKSKTGESIFTIFWNEA